MTDESILEADITTVPDLLDHILQHTWEMIARGLPQILAGMLVFLFFIIIALLIDRALARAHKKAGKMRAPVIHLLRTVTRITLYTVGAVTGLGSAGVEVSALVASLGLSGVAVSFALKDSLSNVVAGLMILLYQPYRTGQRIRVQAEEGKVQTINLRYTKLDIDEGGTVIIPNAKMLTETVRILP